MSKGIKNDVCICGHLTSNHELYGTPYARCRDWSARVKCNCSMEARVVAHIETGKAARFKKVTRGAERPHALVKAVKALREIDHGDVKWVVNVCDKCGGPFQGDPHFYVLDSEGGIQRPGKPFPLGSILGRDTGKHVAICALCDFDDQSLTGYKEP